MGADIETAVTAAILAGHPRDAIIERARAGEPVSVADVRESIEAAKGRQCGSKPIDDDADLEACAADIGADGARPNGARALMASRQEPADSLDYFPTPPWATRALIERVLPVLGIQPSDLAGMDAWEAACGEGHMAEVLTEYFGRVIATDVHDYGYGEAPLDFLDESTKRVADWNITNPPFDDKAIRFVLRALKLARVGVAMFTRLQWLETIERYELVFRDHPPTLVSFFVERVNLCKGRWEPDGTTATAYCWLVWVHGEQLLPPFWIPPGCREHLSRPDDVARFTTHPVTRRIPSAPPPACEMPPIPDFLDRTREAVS